MNVECTDELAGGFLYTESVETKETEKGNMEKQQRYL